MKNVYRMLGLLLTLAFVLSACGPAAPVATEAPAVKTEEPMAATEEPMAETEEPMMDEGIDCMGAAPGDVITMFYQWSGTEEENLNKILAPLIDACGIVLQPEATRDQALLDTRVQAGTPTTSPSLT